MRQTYWKPVEQYGTCIFQNYGIKRGIAMYSPILREAHICLVVLTRATKVCCQL